MEELDPLDIINETITELMVLKKQHLQIIFAPGDAILDEKLISQVTSCLRIINRLGHEIERLARLREKMIWIRAQDVPLRIVLDTLSLIPRLKEVLQDEDVKKEIMELIKARIEADA